MVVCTANRHLLRAPAGKTRPASPARQLAALRGLLLPSLPFFHSSRAAATAAVWRATTLARSGATAAAVIAPVVVAATVVVAVAAAIVVAIVAAAVVTAAVVVVAVVSATVVVAVVSATVVVAVIA